MSQDIRGQGHRRGADRAPSRGRGRKSPSSSDVGENQDDDLVDSRSGEIIAYTFGENKVRTMFKDGAVSFVAVDVCQVLELANPRQVLSRLDEDERGYANLQTTGVTRGMATVNESGLFALILTSRKPEAKAFRRWITGEVIPSIRKTGSYRVPTPDVQPTKETDIGVRANDFGVHVVLVAPDMHSVRKVEFDRLIAESNALQGEIMACSLISAASMLDMIALRRSVALDGGTPEDSLGPTIQQGAQTARRFLQSIWAEKQDGSAKTAATSP